MHHAFLDRYSDLDSPLHRLDPRARLLGLGCAMLVVVSEPALRPQAWLLYALLIALLVTISGVPLHFVLRRWMLAAPFILLTSGVLLLAGPAGPGDPGLAAVVLAKASAAIILLTLLTATGRFNGLLHAMRTLRLPALLSILLAFIYRYIFILSDELQRTSRARRSRTPDRPHVGPIRSAAWQTGTVFVRGYDRSRRTYAAMCARGFDGTFPQPLPPRFGARDTAATLLLAGAFLAVRLT